MTSLTTTLFAVRSASDGIAHARAGNSTRMLPDASGDWDEYYQLSWEGLSRGDWREPSQIGSESQPEGRWRREAATVSNRLIEVKDSLDATVATYAYDGLFRRTTKTVSGTTRHFYYSDRWKSAKTPPPMPSASMCGASSPATVMS